MMRGLLLLALGLSLSSEVQGTASGARWPDCGDELGSETGPLGSPLLFNKTFQGSLFYVLHPQAPQAAPFPVVVFMHGLTGQYEMYRETLQFYASHGFVVIFPFIKGPNEDKRSFPPVTNTNGDYMLKGIELAEHMQADSTSQLHGLLDLDNMALNGHSMGATCTIMAAKRLPAKKVKVAVAQHPGVCGPFGPPPWPSTWMPADLAEAKSKMPVLFTTATNDGAFWPAPMTAEHELGCFDKTPNATGAALGHAYAQFSEQACAEDKARMPAFPDGGHNCPLKVPSPETPWVFAALKLYAQLGGDVSSRCYQKLWGQGSDSMQRAATVELSRVVPPSQEAMSILV